MDPAADRLLIWDDSADEAAGAIAWLALDNLQITDATLKAAGVIERRRKFNDFVSGTLAQATHMEGHVNNVNGAITIPNPTATGCSFVLINGTSSSITITRGGSFMFVNGVNVSSAVLGARRAAHVEFAGSSVCHLEGGVA